MAAVAAVLMDLLICDLSTTEHVQCNTNHSSTQSITSLQQVVLYICHLQFSALAVQLRQCKPGNAERLCGWGLLPGRAYFVGGVIMNGILFLSISTVSTIFAISPFLLAQN